MRLWKFEEALSNYSGHVPIDDDYLAKMKMALLNPQSQYLSKILKQAVETQCSSVYRLEKGSELQAEALEIEPHLFHFEAIERAAVASSLSIRTREKANQDKDWFIIWQICNWCARTYRDFNPRFSTEDVDRLLRALTLATEDIAASNEFIHIRRFLKPAFSVPLDVRECQERSGLYRRLIVRLEHSEAQTRTNQARRDDAFYSSQDLRRKARGTMLAKAREAECFFKNDDYEMLAALRRSVSAADQSAAEAARLKDDADIEARRDSLFAMLSPLWRHVFIRLLDLEYDSDRLPAVIAASPDLKALNELSNADRGVVLSQIARLFRSDHDHSSAAAEAPRKSLGALARRTSSRRVDDHNSDLWRKLNPVGSLLVKRAVTLGDAEMSEVLRTSQKWRELCDFGLLESAESTLQSGPAPLTIQALTALAKRPSHCIVPSDAGGENEGDVWWNEAPRRAIALVQRYGGGSPHRG